MVKKLDNKKKFSNKLVKKKIDKIKIDDLNIKNLISDKVATSASFIAKSKSIRRIVKNFQFNCAYNPPKKFSGSILDGRDIGTVILPKANFKFFINASVEVRAKRRLLEKNISFLHEKDEKCMLQSLIDYIIKCSISDSKKGAITPCCCRCCDS